MIMRMIIHNPKPSGQDHRECVELVKVIFLKLVTTHLHYSRTEGHKTNLLLP